MVQVLKGRDRIGRENLLPQEFLVTLPNQCPPPRSDLPAAEEGARAGIKYLSASAKERVPARYPRCAALAQGTRGAPARGQKVSARARDAPGASGSHPLPSRTRRRRQTTGGIRAR